MPTLPTRLRRLLTVGTTAIEAHDLQAVNDLIWFKAVIHFEKDGKHILKLTKRKGAKSRVREMIRDGKVIMR